MSVILVDTSVWVTHLRSRHDRLVELLDAGEVLCHPFVIGELACGSVANRSSILALLGDLAQTPVATHDEVMGFLDDHRLYGCGLGWIDAHLLTSALLAGSRLWTLDARLDGVAQVFGAASGVNCSASRSVGSRSLNQAGSARRSTATSAPIPGVR